jgi:hypothetical protein
VNRRLAFIALFSITLSGAVRLRGAPSLFSTLPSAAGAVRQIFFDPGSSFGGNMLLSTTSGNIHKVNSSGVVSLLASVGLNASYLQGCPGA